MTQNLPAPRRNDRPILPQEKFWQHYSPHHEAPLSGVMSFGLHLLVIALAILASYYFAKVSQAAEKLPSVAPILVEGLEPLRTSDDRPEGGGDRRPEQAARAYQQSEDVAQSPQGGSPRPRETRESLPSTVRPPTGQPEVPLVSPGVGSPPDTGRAIEELEQFTARLRRDLLSNLGAVQGDPRPGSGTSQTPGRGPGEGPGTGTKIGAAERQQRVLRWKLIFKTENGKDYARQLEALGAMIAYADAREPNKFHVIRDLSQLPAKGKIEDISTIKRIFWIDDRPQSVRSLATALGITPVPERVVAFFPEELEKTLLKLEHDYNGLAEEDIAATMFDVVPDGRGKYKPVVVGQTPVLR
jgi:hypothetical protein